MRILQIAPLWETVPPPGYGGTETVVSLLTEALVQQGHDVTLVASGDSRTAARLVSVYPRSLRQADELGDRSPYDWLHISTAMAMAREFDIVHNHAGELAMAMSGLIDTPILTTTHCLTTCDTVPLWSRYRGAYNTVSRAQREHFRRFERGSNYVGHVYNAIDVDTFPFQREKSDDLLFLSRISPEKGTEIAIDVARRTGRRLLLAGKVDRVDRAYFEQVVEPLIDGEQIVFVGEADGSQKRELFRNVYALLMPLRWEEPFGLVMTEALACGTPVIAFPRGAAPEIVQHGETGYLVGDAGEMADAISDVKRLDPAACRADVQLRFGPRALVQGYLNVYDRLLDSPRPQSGSIDAHGHDQEAAARHGSRPPCASDEMGIMSIRHIGNLDDQDVEVALNEFLRNALPLDHDVTVEFSGGVATIGGNVASLTAAQAVEELVMAHDGVESVVNHLTLAAPVAAQESRPPV